MFVSVCHRKFVGRKCFDIHIHVRDKYRTCGALHTFSILCPSVCLTAHFDLQHA